MKCTPNVFCYDTTNERGEFRLGNKEGGCKHTFSILPTTWLIDEAWTTVLMWSIHIEKILVKATAAALLVSIGIFRIFTNFAVEGVRWNVRFLDEVKVVGEVLRDRFWWKDKNKGKIMWVMSEWMNDNIKYLCLNIYINKYISNQQQKVWATYHPPAFGIWAGPPRSLQSRARRYQLHPPISAGGSGGTLAGLSVYYYYIYCNESGELKVERRDIGWRDYKYEWHLKLWNMKLKINNKRDYIKICLLSANLGFRGEQRDGVAWEAKEHELAR